MNFIGLDTETYKGRACLICCKDKALVFPRSFVEIYDTFAAWGEKFCLYNLNYDVRAVLIFLPRRILLTLNFKTQAIIIKQRKGGLIQFYLKYIPSKYLLISRKDLTSKGKVEKKYAPMYFYDCFQFYKKSLNAASKEVLGEEKIDIPAAWYKRMAQLLRGKQRDMVIKYCMKDAELCERLFAHLQAQCEKAKLDFSHPVSAGSLALHKFKAKMQNKIPRRENEFYQMIYYGGRIEVLKRGYFDRVQIWDINSAYPSALCTFYDPAICNVVEGRKFTKSAAYGIYKVTVNIPLHDNYISPLLLDLTKRGKRDASALIYPCGKFQTWVDYYTMHDLIAKRMVKRIEFSREWIPPRLGHRWFPEIATIYQERKSNPEVSLAWKLILNSLYGKFAEQVRLKVSASKVDSRCEYFQGEFFRQIEFPTGHTNFLVAAHITGHTRSRLYNMMQTMGEDNIIACHTDGIYTKPLNVNLGEQGDNLGAWKLEHDCNGMVMIGTGIYAFCENDTWTNRFRGFNTQIDIRKRLASVKRYSKIRLMIERVPTLKETIESNDFSKYNQFIKKLRILDVNFDSKREWDRPFKSASEILRSQIDSLPLYIA